MYKCGVYCTISENANTCRARRGDLIAKAFLWRKITPKQKKKASGHSGKRNNACFHGSNEPHWERKQQEMELIFLLLIFHRYSPTGTTGGGLSWTPLSAFASRFVLYRFPLHCCTALSSTVRHGGVMRAGELSANVLSTTKIVNNNIKPALRGCYVVRPRTHLDMCGPADR